MKQWSLKQIERGVLLSAGISMLFFVAGYLWGMIFFYCFLASMLICAMLWVGYWKCPHCGKRLWFNFEDAHCRHCRKDIFVEKEKKYSTENPGFFHW